VDTDHHEHSGARITPLCREKSRGVFDAEYGAIHQNTYTSQIHAYETDTSKRSWHSVPSWPPHRAMR